MINTLLLLALAVLPAAAAPLAATDVPEPLRPWVKWALHGREAETCPMMQGRGGGKVCAWPGTLRLELDEAGGRFSQSWKVYTETWAVLPGDAANWPQDTLLDGAPASVLQREGRAAVLLKPGTRSLSGRFKWSSLPEGLEIPRETGLVSLTVSGRAVDFPARDEAGRLWVQKARQQGTERSHLELSVHRRLSDGVPVLLTTHIQLRVSGKAREEVLGRALPAGFSPMAVVSPLPARIDPDGRLRVQARAGTWDMEIAARKEARGDDIALGEPGGAWDEDEAWAFESDEALRGVSVEGVPAVDPQQTEMPGAWRRFPAYLMKSGSTMRLVERRRGDDSPQADRITLDRTMWLDFSGRGFTVRDRLSGELHRAWRLSMARGTLLGRVSVDGQDQFITRLSSAGPDGVEVRAGTLNVEADSIIRRRHFSNPAVGWMHDFERVGGRLNLPPGWRLVHAWGVDSARPSWVTSWTLLDLFLVLVLAFAVGRLWDRRWGAVALAAAVLSWHEPGALRWVWLWALAAEALVRGLPEGRFRAVVKTARAAAWACAVMWLIPFVVTQVRVGLFPQLENLRTMGRMANFAQMAMPGAAGAPAEMEFADASEQFDEGMAEDKAMKAAPEPSSITPLNARSGGIAGLVAQSAYQDYRPARKMKQLLALDPRSAVATGPGVPNWNWRQVQLSWNGPVRSDQRLKLWLLGPKTNLFMALLRSALAVFLWLLVVGLPVEEWLKSLRVRGTLTKNLRWLFPALLLAMSVPGAAAQMPDDELLKQLGDRLLAAPDCVPDCAQSPRMRLEAAGQTLRVRLEIHAGAPVAVPLAGAGPAWTPRTVLLDGAPAAGVRREGDGSLWLPMSAGAHQVTLEGPLPEVEIVPLPLPLTPRRVEASVSGWTLHGLREDGRAESGLQLARQRAPSGPAGARAGGTLPPFVRVERTLRLGLSWEMETRVVRLTPTGTPVIVEVPLLAGESLTSDLAVKKGKVQVSLGAQSYEARWTSVLSETEALTLKAPDSVPWTEVWEVAAGPVWHVEASGIPPVRAPGAERRRIWKPWPGEELALSISRPEGVEGRTLTVDRADLTLSPGTRATDARLSVQLRSSRGAQHPFTLPDGADLQSVSIDGQALSAKLEDGKVIVPVQPGTHQVELVWREPRGLGLMWSARRAGLGAPAVNATVRIAMPADRWTLLLGGPRLGPAVLFWSLLFVLLLVSAGLGRLGLTPLSWKAWFLLSIGLSQVPLPAAAFVALWMVLLGWRAKEPREDAGAFDAVQVLLALMTPAALACLFAAIKAGLLGRPEMQIAGNGSSALSLSWYADKVWVGTPKVWVASVPLGVYRLAMLAWALWLANALLGWLKWGWACYSTGGLWKPLRRKAEELPPPPAP